MGDKQVILSGEQAIASNKLIFGNLHKQTVIYWFTSLLFLGKISWNKQLTHVDTGNIKSQLSHSDTDCFNSSPLHVIIFQPRLKGRSLSSGEMISSSLY